MNRPVPQVIHMHLPPPFEIDDPVIFIHHIKDFLRRINRRMFPILSQESKFRPIIHRQVLSPCRHGVSLGQRPLLPHTLLQIQK